MDLEVENLLAIHLDDISYMNTLKKYEMIYEDVLNDIFRELLTKLHSNITENFKLMNGRLPTNFSEAHFWADPSRSLIKCLEIAEDLYYNLKDTEYAIKIDEYYVQVFEKCNTFLSSSGGSAIPKDMDKIHHKKRTFYRQLLPSDIKGIIQGKENQKTVAIRFNELPKTS